MRHTRIGRSEWKYDQPEIAQLLQPSHARKKREAYGLRYDTTFIYSTSKIYISFRMQYGECIVKRPTNRKLEH